MIRADLILTTDRILEASRQSKTADELKEKLLIINKQFPFSYNMISRVRDSYSLLWWRKSKLIIMMKEIMKENEQSN